MAFKHINICVGYLSKKYAEAQKLFEDAAESLSGGMIDPEVYQEFCEKKNKVDVLLANYSKLFQDVKDRENFVKTLSKQKAELSRVSSLIDRAKNGPDSEEFLVRTESYLRLLENQFSVYEFVEEEASWPKRKKKFRKASGFTYKEYREAFQIAELEDALKLLKEFIEQELG